MLSARLVAVTITSSSTPAELETCWALATAPPSAADTAAAISAPELIARESAVRGFMFSPLTVSRNRCNRLSWEFCLAPRLVAR